MDMTLEQLAEAIIYYGKIAGGVSAIVLLVASILRPQIKKVSEQHKQKDEEQSKQNTKIMEALSGIEQALKRLTDDVASLQMDRLDQAHDFYCNQQGWIDSSRLQVLSEWYKSYRAKGLNHLAEHWLNDLEELPSSPPDKNKETRYCL